MKRLTYILFFFLPIALVITAQYLSTSRGPFWLGNNLDPEYVYLLNAANLANLQGVGHIDHPGTPVQVLGAVTIAVLHTVAPAGSDDMQIDVVRNPEYYLNAINNLLVSLNVLMLLAIGIAAYKWTSNLLLSLWLQAAPFFSITLLHYGLTRVTPEPLLFFASSMLVVLIVGLTRPTGLNTSTKQTGAVLLFALLTGFGIAVKITFIPIMAIPLVALRGIKHKLYYLLASALGCVVFTLPIIRMYPFFFRWIFKLTTHSGQYGSGAAEIISTQTYWRNIQALLAANSLYTFVLTVTLAIVALSLVTPRLRNKITATQYGRYLTGTAAAQILALLMVAKHSANHYLLPVLNLSGISLWLLFNYLSQLRSADASPRPPVPANPFARRLRPIVFMVTIALLYAGINPLGKIIRSAERLSGVKTNCLALQQRIEQNYKTYAKIYYYRSSAPQYALKFGNDLSRSYHSAALQGQYNDIYFYDIWTNRFTNFDYDQSIPFKDIQSRYGDNIIFCGNRGITVPGLTLIEIERGGAREGVYRPHLAESAAN